MHDEISGAVQQDFTWVKVFPWLSMYAPENTTVHWSQRISDTPADSKVRYLKEVVSISVERLFSWKILNIFPYLPSTIDVADFVLPVRAMNALDRESCATTSDLLDLRLSDIQKWHYVGKGTVNAVLFALAQASVDAAKAGYSRSIDSKMDQENQSDIYIDENYEISLKVRNLAQDVNQIAKWYALIGKAGEKLFSGPNSESELTAVSEAYSKLTSLTVSDFLTETQKRATLATHFDAWIADADPRATKIICERLLSDDPRTLEEIATQFDVTRERIRQIETVCRQRIVQTLAAEEPFSQVAALIRDFVQEIRPFEDLKRIIPVISSGFSDYQIPLWKVFSKFDEAYEIDGEWCAPRSIAEARNSTRELINRNVNTYGVASLSEVMHVNTTNPEKIIESNISWIKQCGYLVKDRHVITEFGSVGDYAAAILWLRGEPLNPNEIVREFVHERNARSLANTLSLDERFERVDRDRWGLKEWNLGSYSTIKTMIREYLQQRGGEAPLNEVVESLTNRFSVSSKSVIAYASAPPFSTSGGILRIEKDRKVNGRPPARTRRIFRRRNAWAYRIEITAEHLRGSGSTAPVALASIYGIQPGQVLQLRSKLGDQSLSWVGLQPQISTIRRHVVDSKVNVGDQVFLVFHDDKYFSFEIMKPLTTDPLTNALKLAGLPTDMSYEKARKSLADVLCIPSESSAASVIGALNERGDYDISNYLLEVREELDAEISTKQQNTDTNIDDIMDLL